jgi:hypothetical protein
MQQRHIGECFLGYPDSLGTLQKIVLEERLKKGGETQRSGDKPDAGPKE